jgi:hypothetical protein
MADHVRKQLRAAVATAVTGLPTTGARVYTARAYALDADTETPGLLILTPSEGAEPGDIHGGIGRQITVTVTAVVKSTGAVQDTLDQIAKEVEPALVGPAKLQVGAKRVDIEYLGAEFVMDDSADRKTAELEMSFRAEIFTAPGVPDVLI